MLITGIGLIALAILFALGGWHSQPYTYEAYLRDQELDQPFDSSWGWLGWCIVLGVIVIICLA